MHAYAVQCPALVCCVTSRGYSKRNCFSILSPTVDLFFQLLILFVTPIQRLSYYSFLIGVPFINCSLVVAHFFLHSGMHSARLFCSSPLGLVHSYRHLDRQASYAGSFLVPLRAGSTSAAKAGDDGPETAAVTPAAKMDDERLDMAERRSTVEACSAVDGEQDDVSAPPVGPAEKDLTDETSTNESSTRSERELFIILK